MKRNGWYRKFFIAVGILAVMIAVLWDWDRLPEDSLSHDGAMVTDFHMKTVAGAALVNETGGVALMVQDGEIEILDAPREVFFSDSNRKAFLYRMAHVPAKKVLGKTKTWEPYGLEYPQAKLTLFLTDESRAVITLGDETPLEDGWYMRKEGDPTLYLVDSVTARMMRYSLDDFREVDVLPVIRPDSLEEMTRFCLIRDDEILEIQGEKQEGTVRFFLTSPFEAPLSRQTVAEKILSPFGDMESLRFVKEDPPEKDSESSDKGEYRVQIEIAGEERELVFIPDKENTFYCKNPQRGQMIVVEGEGINAFLNRSATELMGSTLYPANAADMEYVEVSAEGLKKELELRGQGELLRGYSGGKKLGQAETLKIFQTLTMIPPAEPLEENVSLKRESLLTLYFRRKNGAEDILELIPISQRRCAVQINGFASFTTYTATVQEMIQAVKGMGS